MPPYLPKKSWSMEEAADGVYRKFPLRDHLQFNLLDGQDARDLQTLRSKFPGCGGRSMLPTHLLDGAVDDLLGLENERAAKLLWPVQLHHRRLRRHVIRWWCRCVLLLYLAFSLRPEGKAGCERSSWRMYTYATPRVRKSEGEINCYCGRYVLTLPAIAYAWCSFARHSNVARNRLSLGSTYVVYLGELVSWQKMVAVTEEFVSPRVRTRL